MHEELLVSVLMPVYNGADYIEEAINSILVQTFDQFEFILIDDGSSDNSDEIIKRYQDNRIVFIKHKVNKGLVESLNSGLSNAKGKYIARMDQDDVAMPTRLARQVTFMESNPEFIVCGTSVQYIGNKPYRQVLLSDEEIKVSMMFGCPFVHPTVMIRRSVLVEYNLRYNEKYKHAEDYGLWVDMMEYGKYANLPTIELRYRIHELQYSVTYQKAMAMTSYLIRKTYLEKLNIELPSEEMELFSSLMYRNVDLTDLSALKRLRDFLAKLPSYFSRTQMHDKLVALSAYKHWKRLMIRRQSMKINSYWLFVNSGLAWVKFEPKVHLWFIWKLIVK